MRVRRILASTVMVMAVALAGNASARSVGSGIGYSRNWSDQACMRSAWVGGGVTNECGYGVIWEMLLPVDRTGTFSISIVGNVSATSYCSAWTLNQDGSGASGTSLTGWYGFGVSVQTATGTSPNVPSGGYLLLECVVAGPAYGSNQSIYGVTWQ